MNESIINANLDPRLLKNAFELYLALIVHAQQS